MAKMKILCLDFDGVIHSYTSGWQGADVINDPPVPGAMEFLFKAVAVFDVHILSSRSNQDGGIEAMKAAITRWMMLEGVEGNIQEFVEKVLKWPTHKPPAFITLDDRCVRFDGTWPGLSELSNFKPWNYGAI